MNCHNIWSRKIRVSSAERALLLSYHPGHFFSLLVSLFIPSFDSVPKKRSRWWCNWTMLICTLIIIHINTHIHAHTFVYIKILLTYICSYLQIFIYIFIHTYHIYPPPQPYTHALNFIYNYTYKFLLNWKYILNFFC